MWPLTWTHPHPPSDILMAQMLWIPRSIFFAYLEVMVIYSTLLLFIPMPENNVQRKQSRIQLSTFSWSPITCLEGSSTCWATQHVLLYLFYLIILAPNFFSSTSFPHNTLIDSCLDSVKLQMHERHVKFTCHNRTWFPAYQSSIFHMFSFIL